jgi:hypothetical protein
MISVPNQLVGAYEGQTLTLECQSEAYPKSINYWTKENGEIIAQGKFCWIFINRILTHEIRTIIKKIACIIKQKEAMS